MIALVAGAYVMVARKGTRTPSPLGLVVCGVHGGAGRHHHGGLSLRPHARDTSARVRSQHLRHLPLDGGGIILLAVALAIFAASRQRKAVWAHVHAQAMLFSYYLLVGGLINEMLVRVTVLRNLALAISPGAGNPANTCWRGWARPGP